MDCSEKEFIRYYYNGNFNRCIGLLLITTDGIAAFASIADSIQVPWFILIFVAVVVGWLLEALVLHFFCKSISPMEVLAFFNYRNDWTVIQRIDSFATGGQAMQIYYMRKLGMDTGGAGSIIAVKSLVYQVIMVLFALVMVF